MIPSVSRDSKEEVRRLHLQVADLYAHGEAGDGTITPLLCLAFSLTACGRTSGDEADAQNEAETSMTEEECQSRVEELSGDIGSAMSSMSGLSATDEESFRERIETIRAMVEPFREFAAITNPPRPGRRLMPKSPRGAADSRIPWRDCATAPKRCWMESRPQRIITAPQRSTPPASSRHPHGSPRDSE